VGPPARKASSIPTGSTERRTARCRSAVMSTTGSSRRSVECWKTHDRLILRTIPARADESKYAVSSSKGHSRTGRRAEPLRYLEDSVLYVCALLRDRPRPIDQFIDYFGSPTWEPGSLADPPLCAALLPRKGSWPLARLATPR
jgi:hypothetical protein